jgi:hypothetical protein
MKKILPIVLLLTILFSCKNVEMYELNDGTFITKRKSDRIAKKVIRREFRKLSKEDQESVLMITVDTNQNY